MPTQTRTATTTRYVRPTAGDRLTSRVLARLARLGISLFGTRELRVAGRRSGLARTTVVNLLTVDGTRYLVAPRGTTEWVRNLRFSGGGELRVGRRVERFVATEVADEDKAPVLQAYLARWAFEVARFFPGLDRHATVEDLAAFTGSIPAFRVDPERVGASAQ